MKKIITLLSCAVFTLATLITPVVNSPTALADTRPPSGTPATVSADPLPTVQINDGVVWAQTIVGNTVYATGKFTKARPAGAAPGTSEVTRNNILAYDITTGNLLGFNPSLNAEGQAITVSPDKKLLYVGGKFTSVNGQARNRIAVFDLATGNLTGFSSGPTNGTVKALAAVNGYVYVGGSFTTVTGGQSRSRLAAYSSSGGQTTWAPKANAIVLSMAISPDQSKVIIGGSFDKINSTTYYGLAAVQTASPGNPVAFASQSSTYPIRDYDAVNSSSGINSITTNGNLMFITGFSNGNTQRPGAFEGRAAINPTNGNIVWVNDCHGDSYGAIPIGNVLYSVTHAHDCQPAGAFPETVPRSNWRALAETITVDGKNGPSTFGYQSYEGLPRSTQLNWYPKLDAGKYTQMNQAAWSITGNSNYISLGGEFLRVEGKAQQGLVRYAISSLAPNKIGPSFSSFSVRAGGVDSSGRQGLAIRAASDRDNGVLTYRLYRGTSTTPIHTFTMDSRFYKLPEYTSFVDSGLAPGSVHQYRVTATDPFGNSATSYSLVDDNRGGHIKYAGSGWINSQNRNQGDYWNGIHYTTSNGSSYSYSFNGTGFELVGHRNQYTGRISISVDGGTPVTISTYNSTHMGAQKSLYTKSGMTRGNHTVRVTKVDGTNMVIDGIRIIP